MMHAISRTPENHMSPSAVAACMAPLLLQPILAGECNLTDNVEFSDDDSAQLLAAAYAARTAQAIITFILEEYHHIFSDANSNSCSVSDDLDKGEGNDESTYADIQKKKNIANLDARNIKNGGIEENPEPIFSEELSRSSMDAGSDLYDNMQVKKICSIESQGSPAVKRLDVKQLEMKMNDLLRRLAKEAKVNELLQASLERRKQALLERRSILHQDVEKLHQQLIAERDLRLAMEVGLSENMSSGKLSNQEDMTRAEQEEITIAEADVARLKQKVAALHRQFSMQQDHYGFPSDAKPRQRSLQQDFDATLGSVNYERMQKIHGISSRANRRTAEGIQLASSTRNYTDISELVNSMSISNSECWEVLCNRNDIHPTTNSPRHKDFELSSSPTTSSTLAELVNRISFFRKRGSQLTHQLQTLDAQADSTPARNAVCQTPSRSWT